MPDIRPKIQTTLLLLALFAVLLAPASPLAALTWHTDARQAEALAAEGDRLIVVDLYAEWCTWCKVLDEQVFSSKPFEAFARDFVLLRLDVDHDPAGGELQARHQVEALPTTLILTSRGALVGKVQGMAPTNQYIERMQHEIDVYRNLEKLFRAATASGQDAGGAGAADPRQVRALAQAFHERGDGERAAALYRRLETLDWQDSEGPAGLSLRLADALRLAGRYDQAAAEATEARTLAGRTQDERLLEAADLLAVRIATDEGDCAEEKAAIEHFLEQHPESRYTDQVWSHLAQIKNGLRNGC